MKITAKAARSQMTKVTSGGVGKYIFAEYAKNHNR